MVEEVIVNPILFFLAAGVDLFLSVNAFRLCLWIIRTERIEKEREEIAMTASEIIKQVSITHGAVLIRYRKEPHEKGQPWQYDVKGLFVGKKTGWIILDITTANAMKAVYDALKPEHQEKWDFIPFQRLVDFTWKNVH